MKKILFICNHLQYSDGVAICLRNLVNEICNNYEIHILNLYINNPEFVNGISSKVTIHKVFGFYIKGLRSFTNKFLLKKLGNHQLLKTIEFDYIVSYQNGTPSILINEIKNSGLQNKAKYIGFIHGFNSKQVSLYKNLDAIVSISEDGRKNADRMLESFTGRLLHIRNIYSMDDIITKSKKTIKLIKELHDKGKIVYITVSRLDPGKGLDRFVNAFFDYHIKDKDAIGIIIGDGPSRKAIRKLINKKSMNDYMLMLGAKDNPYPYILQSDYFCCPSRSEGLCTSCVEAAILKKPILSTEVSGAHEIIDDPQIGIVVENNDNSFYDGLVKISNIKIEEHNFVYAKKKWDPKLTADQYISFFDSL